MSAQLRLVTDAPPTFDWQTADPVRRVFEHWLFMFARSPARCKLGPTRRQAIAAALAMGYDADTLALAVEGMAGDALEGCTARMQEAMRELEWLLAKESRIEQYAKRGEDLRAQAEQAAEEEQRRAMRPAEPVPTVDPAAAAAARERLRQLAANSRRGGF
jgi:hypothetical protein